MRTVYHASSKKDLKVLIPQRTFSNDKYIGEFVFATRSITLAIMYLANRGSATLMEPDTTSPYIVICSDKYIYIKGDVGGAIYYLPEKTFDKSPQAGLEAYELVSTKEVKPINKVAYASSIKAMKDRGIDIYFVDEDQFKRLIDSSDRPSVLRSIASSNRL